MLEETSHDADNPGGFRETLQTGAQAATVANDEVDLNAGLRCLVERADYVDVFERFGLQVYDAVAAIVVMLYLAVNQA
mgnify:CR=1 FL=1